MITNLAKQTLDIINRAGFKTEQVEYVVFWNIDTENYERCSFGEFMDVAEDINFEEYIELLDVRKKIFNGVQIVGDTWWLRRPDENEECDDWIIERRPVSIEESEPTVSGLDSYYLINDIDLLESNDYVISHPEIKPDDEPPMDYFVISE